MAPGLAGTACRVGLVLVLGFALLEISRPVVLIRLHGLADIGSTHSRKLMRNSTGIPRPILDTASAPRSIVRASGVMPTQISRSEADWHWRTIFAAAGGSAAASALLAACVRMWMRRQSNVYEPISTSDQARSLSSEISIGRKLKLAITYYTSPEIISIALLTFSVLLYYTDMALDLNALSLFFQRKQYSYLVSNVLGILVAHVVGLTMFMDLSDTQSHTPWLSSLVFGALEPLRLLREAVRVVWSIPPLRRNDIGESVLDADYFEELHVRNERLKDLKVKITTILHAESFVEAPVSVLVQMYAILQDDGSDRYQRQLVISSCIGVLSATKALVGLDALGHVSASANTPTGRPFNYIVGSGFGLVEGVVLALFRFVEFTSRLSTLAFLQHQLRLALPLSLWTHFIMVGSLALSSVVLASLASLSRPWHLALSIPAAFAFPGPLLQPVTAKVGPTSLLTHLSLRCAETLAAWCAIAAVVSHRRHVVSTGLVFWAVIDDWSLALAMMFAGAFTLMCVAIVALAICRSQLDLLQVLGSQLETDDDGCILWPVFSSELLDPTCILQDLGMGNTQLASNHRKISGLSNDGVLRIASKLACSDVTSLDLSSNPEVSSIGWSNLFRTLAGGSLEHVKLTQCHFSDETAFAIAEPFGSMKSSLKSLDFQWNNSLTSTGWKSLFEAIMSGGLEEVKLGNCDLSDQAASAIARPLGSMKSSLTSLDFTGNSSIMCAGWTHLFGALVGGRLEEIKLEYCGLTDAAAMAIAQPLSSMKSSLTKVDFAGNSSLTSDGWKCLFGALVGGRLEEVKLGDCGLTDDGALAVAEALGSMKSSFKSLDFTGYSSLNSTGWNRVFASLVGGRGLEKIKMEGCGLSDDDASAIADPLGSMKSSLRSLDFTGNGSVKMTGWKCLFGALDGGGLEEIKLRKCRLSDEKGLAIAEYLGSMKGSLKRLDLTGNRSLTSTGWKCLFGALVGGCLEDIQLGHCRLSDEAASAISESLGSMKVSLKTLDLGGNSTLTSTGWTCLFGALIGGRLEDVKLGSCDLSDGACIYVAEVLVSVQAFLHHLDLSQNDLITCQGWSLLLDAISKLQLRSLDLSGCRLEGSLFEVGILSHPQCLQHITNVHLPLREDMRRSVNIIRSQRSLPEYACALVSCPFLSQGKGSPTLWRAVNYAECIEIQKDTSLDAESLNKISKRALRVKKFKISSVDATYQEPLQTMTSSLRSLDLTGNDSINSSVCKQLFGALVDGRLEELKLRDCRLSDDAAAIIAESLASMKSSLKSLDFTGNNSLNITGWKSLFGALDGGGLENVWLGHCDLSDETASAIAEPLSTMKGSLKSLDFTGNSSLTSSGWTCLFGALIAGGLEDVKLGWCKLSDEAAIVIAESLGSMKECLKKLDCSGTGALTSTGWEHLFGALGGGRLEEVNLGSCKLSDEAVSAIAEALMSMNSSLKRLDLDWNGSLTSAGWKHLFGALVGVRLEKLNLNQCRLSDEAALAIAGALGLMKMYLKSLDVTGISSLTSTGWTCLFGSLAGGGLEELRLAACGLSDEAALAISRNWGPMNSSLKRVDFSLNRSLKSTGWKCLFGALVGGGLEDVCLGSCDLSDETASAIAEPLGTMKGSLKSLDFSGNTSLTSSGWKCLFGALVGGSLEEVELGACHLSDEAALVIAEPLGSMKSSLKRLGIRANEFTSRGRQPLFDAMSGGILSDRALDQCLRS